MSNQTIIVPAAVSGDNNPDNYAAASNTYLSRDYETQINAEVVEYGTNIVCTYTYGSNYGWDGGGAWRASPINGAAQHQDNGGWNAGGAAGGSIPVDECDILVVSYMFYISQALVDDIEDAPGGFWGSGNKLVGVKMWNEAGDNVNTDTRQVIKYRMYDGNSYAPEAGIYHAHLMDGAGTEYVLSDDASDTQTPRLSALADEWVWICHVFDASHGAGAPTLPNSLSEDGTPNADNVTRTYIKRQGDTGVIKVLERHGDFRAINEFQAYPYGAASQEFRYTSRGWHGFDGPLFGYWDDISGGEDSSTKYVSLDRTRVTDGWVDPPF